MLPEIGSEFGWDPAALRGEGPTGGLPARHELYATACGALISLLRGLGPRGRVHFPSYFCTGVAEAVAARLPIGWYRHLPVSGPQPETVRAVDGDVVVVQNLFGREDGTPWRAWSEAHPGVTVVEDHSHDPLSAWARTSTAAYAIASLRKTLPLPDGGLVWSPRGLAVPAARGPVCGGSDLKLAGMLLKAAWLAGRPIPKESFRALQQRGEQALLGSEAPPAAVTTAVLPLLDVPGLRAAAIRQAEALVAALPAATPRWRVLPAGAFRVQVLCSSERTRDDLQRHLAGRGIYAPVHWRQDPSRFFSGDAEAVSLAARMLTLPVDHRCGPAEVRRIAEAMQDALVAA